jgi:hypothetical protein
MFTRRAFLQGSVCAAVSASLGDRAASAAAATTATSRPGSPPIDRRAVVARHNVVRTASRRTSPLQVGNGNFAFGADVTGLHTFVPFNTMSNWGWHNAPRPPATKQGDYRESPWNAHGRPVPYPTRDSAHPQASAWLFANPSRVNLGRIGLALLRGDGSTAAENDLTDARQELDLWTGTLNSRFALDGQPVVVTTACHPTHDAVAVRVESPLVANRRLTAFLDFVAPDGRELADYVGTASWSSRYTTTVAGRAPRRDDLIRRLDGDAYHVTVLHSVGTTLQVPDAAHRNASTIVIVRARYGSSGRTADVAPVLRAAVHRGEVGLLVDNETLGVDPAPGESKQLEVTYTVGGVERRATVAERHTWAIDGVDGPNRFGIGGEAALEFVVAFGAGPLPADLPDASATFAAAAAAWPRFWQSGAAIDLSGSADPRWRELERRIVLSQYLLAVNEAGDLPPQESGLVNNGWCGKFHMEMYWWHAAHYALWNRWPLLDRSIGVYERMLPWGRAQAARQGYRGSRWTKMAGPDFHNAPERSNALLAWQQPHPMFFAELDYRAHPNRQTLDRWRQVLFDGADFMASFAFWDQPTNRYVLGPPLTVVSETTDPSVTINPTFELSYWRFGLRIAQQWRERLGLGRDPTWERVLQDLAPLPVEDGAYVVYEGVPDMWTHYNNGHPAMTGALGWLPGDGVDGAVMSATLDRVLSQWKMDGGVWGWDFPMLAMCAARLGDPNRAVEMLLYPSKQFDFDDAGLATGGPFPYFPSNGGLLYAIAMMAAGWDGCPRGAIAPGFPSDGRWVVQAKGFSRAL